jgi:hypothetical protein
MSAVLLLLAVRLCPYSAAMKQREEKSAPQLSRIESGSHKISIAGTAGKGRTASSKPETAAKSGTSVNAIWSLPKASAAFSDQYSKLTNSLEQTRKPFSNCGLAPTTEAPALISSTEYVNALVCPVVRCPSFLLGA